MSRDIVHRCLATSFTLWLRLVVTTWVEGQVPQEFARLGQDSNLEIVHRHQDALACVAPADRDVVEPAVVAQGDRPAGVHAVSADPEVAVLDGRAERDRLRAGGEGVGGSATARKRCTSVITQRRDTP